MLRMVLAGAAHCSHAVTAPAAAALPARSAARKDGYAIHVYAASASMADSCLANADGDFLIVPQLVRRRLWVAQMLLVLGRP